MNKSLETIFRYIDNEMNDSERMVFEKELGSDSSFNEMYLSQIKIHKTLSKVPATSAPSYLADNVMKMIVEKKFATEKFNSFSGLKNIAIGAIISFVIASTLTVIFSNQPMTEYSMGSFAKYLDKVPEVISMPQGVYSISKYICILLIIPMLIVLDGFFQKKNRNALAISKN